MKNIALVMVGVGMALTTTVSAAQYVDGHRTIAAPTQVEIGGQVFDIEANPSTIEAMQHKVAWLQAQVDDAVSAQNALKATTCSK